MTSKVLAGLHALPRAEKCTPSYPNRNSWTSSKLRHN